MSNDEIIRYLFMSTDEIIRYQLMKQDYENFQKTFDEKIKAKHDVIDKKFAQMDKLAQEIRDELGM
ncbi:MAG: hypothetical protein LBP37_00260 [Spirochaetaceae bacterium]|jgi:predicted nuclease with TOPRIM domain|nr:hypothetical protein [Spirochaetaceae bacterium]